MVDKIAHYLMCKGGVYYFTRHVPNDIQKHYEKTRIVMCLKTRSKTAAVKASHALASKLDDFWLKLRISRKRRVQTLVAPFLFFRFVSIHKNVAELIPQVSLKDLSSSVARQNVSKDNAVRDLPLRNLTLKYCEYVCL